MLGRCPGLAAAPLNLACSTRISRPTCCTHPRNTQELAPAHMKPLSYRALRWAGEKSRNGARKPWMSSSGILAVYEKRPEEGTADSSVTQGQAGGAAAPLSYTARACTLRTWFSHNLAPTISEVLGLPTWCTCGRWQGKCTQSMPNKYERLPRQTRDTPCAVPTAATSCYSRCEWQARHPECRPAAPGAGLCNRWIQTTCSRAEGGEECGLGLALCGCRVR